MSFSTLSQGGVLMRSLGIHTFALFLLWSIATNGCFAEEDGAEHADVHIIFSTECNDYFDWQSMGMVHSFITSGQHGRMTRLMACNQDYWKGEDIASAKSHPRIDTHYHPNWAKHPTNGDTYGAYNKPASIVDWLKNYKRNITAEYVVVVDADMIIRHDITVEATGARPGMAVAAHYGYLVGIFKENYMKAKETVKNPHLFRQVGGFVVMHVDDLRRVAPLWLHYTEVVRTDPGNWGNTGDIFNNNGKAGPPWISEMYGYVFGAAEAGVDHQTSNRFMLYPGYNPPAAEPWPLILHYGITYNVEDYAFDKHWHMVGDYMSCEKGTRLFEKPMEKGELKSPPGSRNRRRDEVALDCAWGLYNASVWWRETHCGVAVKQEEVPSYQKYTCFTSPQGVLTCTARSRITPGAVRTPAPTPYEEWHAEEEEGEPCDHEDSSEFCADWAEKGECDRNGAFMLQKCAHACQACDAAPTERKQAPAPREEALAAEIAIRAKETRSPTAALVGSKWENGLRGEPGPATEKLRTAVKEKLGAEQEAQLPRWLDEEFERRASAKDLRRRRRAAPEGSWALDLPVPVWAAAVVAFLAMVGLRGSKREQRRQGRGARAREGEGEASAGPSNSGALARLQALERASKSKKLNRSA